MNINHILDTFRRTTIPKRVRMTSTPFLQVKDEKNFPNNQPTKISMKIDLGWIDPYITQQLCLALKKPFHVVFPTMTTSRTEHRVKALHMQTKTTFSRHALRKTHP